MKKSNKNTEEYINKLFDKYIITNELGNQLIELTKLVEEIKNSLFIELNQIDISFEKRVRHGEHFRWSTICKHLDDEIRRVINAKNI